jgi:hypothetical protein
MMAGSSTKVTTESTFQALFAEKLACKRLFFGILKPIQKNFSETSVCQDFQPLRGT